MLNCRSAGIDDLSSRRVLTELLIQMTAVTNRPGCLVYVVGCTNRMEDCDAALLRRCTQGWGGVSALCQQRLRFIQEWQGYGCRRWQQQPSTLSQQILLLVLSRLGGCACSGNSSNSALQV